jgi:hypothetical protein
MQRSHCNQSLGSPWEINSKYNEHKAEMTLSSLIIKRWAQQDKLLKDKMKSLDTVTLNKT